MICAANVYFSKYVKEVRSNEEKKKKIRKPIEAIRVMRAKRSITLVVFDDNAAYMHHKYYHKTQSNLTPCSYFI